MDPQKFDLYIQQAQKLIPNSSRALLLKLIDQNLKIAGSEEPYQTFFLGERSFFSANYDLALKHYLDAKAISNHNFFCYRASAYVSEARGEFDRAINFARKALAINEDDLPSLEILSRVLSATNHWDEAQQIESRLHALKGVDTPESEPINEEKKEELFCHEFEQTSASSKPLGASVQTAVQTKIPATAIKPATSHPYTDSLLQEPYHCHPLRQGDAPLAGNLTLPVSPLSITSLIEKRMHAFHAQHERTIQNYISKGKRRNLTRQDLLMILNGSKTQSADQQLTDRSRNPDTGLFIRWNEKGIVINPGKNFLSQFHAQGFFLSDVDYVLVTRADAEAYADIQEIYDLNAQLNRVSDSLHVIHYYLNQQSLQYLTSVLQPIFKQERNMVHALELFKDSTDVERVELCQGIQLNYFSTQRTSTSTTSPLGIRLDLYDFDAPEKDSLRIGYLSGIPWSPLLSHHLGPCELLVAGFGNTSAQDLSRHSFSEDGLGFHGTLTLIEEIRPQLFLCSENGGRDGDIRLEIVEYLRKSLGDPETPTYILPADKGLEIELENRHVVCNLTGEKVAPSDIRIVKTQDMFGSLLYLSTRCTLA